MYSFELEGYERACDFTSSILRKAGIMAPPVPLDVLCGHLGIKIVEKNIAPRRAMAQKKQRTIYVNPKDTLERRVRIAHEIGHLILPETYPEMSHDLFAWCLLSPHNWLEDFSRPLTPQVISEEHHLPISVSKKRLRLLEEWRRRCCDRNRPAPTEALQMSDRMMIQNCGYPTSIEPP